MANPLPKFSLLFISLLGLLPAAQASTTTKTPAWHETYAATEPTTVAGIAPVGTQPQILLQAPVRSQTITTAAPVASKTGFDAVPEGQVEPVMKRLKLVEEIIQKYGRAYDYRIHTVRELEQIKDSLEKATPAAAPKPRPAPVAPSAPVVTAPASPARASQAPADGVEESSDNGNAKVPTKSEDKAQDLSI